MADVQPVFMTARDKESALVELHRIEAEVAELKCRVLAGADDVASAHGARDAAAWMAYATASEPAAARAELRLGRALESHPVIAAGMRAGQVSAAQARVIVDAIDELPADVGPDLLARAEQTLVGFAGRHRPSELRRLGRRILEVVAPEVADAHEGEELEAEERRAREAASLRFRDQGDGRTRISGVLPTSVTDRLQHYLQAYTSPRQRPERPGRPDGLDGFGASATSAAGERVPQHRAYARAFAALLELLDPDQLPEHGGDATTVLVTLSLEQLRAELAVAEVIVGDGCTMISAQEARRLACQAAIIPAVLGGNGEVLDLGRARRFHSRAQRRALRLRDRRCRGEGCTIPAAWTEVHHLAPWSQGGATDLDHAACLCSHHHHLIHDRAYDHHRLPNGDIRFHRRT
ncbi:DUF222 domain-containing protein [Nocardioides ginsengisoli]|uniref:DUF222 domain-containing protein n=1 Tax=Nocardioides ginsengisoli TaxID=363868 RepID=A0ABW3W147_9ACTN